MFCGILEDVPLHAFLQVLAHNRASGRVTLTRADGHGTVVLRGGKIIYAATNGARETIGSILVNEGRIAPAALAEALARQSRAAEERRLGDVLLDMGALDAATLERVMTVQVGRVLQEMLGWKAGYVRFEPLDLPERGEVAVDTLDFLVEDGVAPQRALLEGDLLRHVTRGGADAERPSNADGVTLTAIMAEMRTPRFTGEVTLGILRFAARLLERGALFLHTGVGISGIGQFGFRLGEGGCPNDAVRRLHVPLAEPSVLQEVIERREPYSGPLAPLPWNLEIARRLGGPVPLQVAVLPLVVGDRVRLLLYGDNGGSTRAIPPLDELLALMIQAGVSIEKSLLQARLRTLGAPAEPGEEFGAPPCRRRERSDAPDVSASRRPVGQLR